MAMLFVRFRVQYKIESSRAAKLAPDVERVMVSRENESESLRKARLAADVERVILPVIMKVNHCVKRD